MQDRRHDDPIWMGLLERVLRSLTPALTIVALFTAIAWVSQTNPTRRAAHQSADEAKLPSETVRPPIRALSASSDGQFLETLHGSASWRRFDAYTGRELLDRDLQGSECYSHALNGDQNLLLSLQFGSRMDIACSDGTLVVEDFPERGPDEPVSKCSLARNRPRIAALSPQGSLWLIEFDAEAVRSIRHHAVGQRLNNLTMSPDGRFIAMTTGDGRLLIWDVEQHRIIREQTEGPYDSHFVDWSADGTRLIISGLNSQISIWDAATLTRSIEWNVDAKMSYATALSSTGDFAAAADDELIHVWDVITGQEQFCLAGHKGIVSGLQFSHDDRSLFSADLKGELRRWSLIDGREIWCVQ